MKQRAFIIVSLAALAAFGSAQSRSSFKVPSSLTGITVTSSDKLHYNVALSHNATMFYQGKNYKIQDVFGFWLLDNNGDLNADGKSFSVWQYHENYSGPGGIAGYKTNPNKGIEGGENQSYAFKKVYGDLEAYGVHIRLKDCDTLYVELPCTPVPEPASLAALGIGAVALLRRRKRS